MQFFKKTFGGLLLLIVLMVAVLFIREPKLFTAPNTWLIGDTYDGFRTYAAMVYHVKHDSTYMHYEGMHFPYGDKAAFTDNLPLVTNSIKFISQNISDISDHCGGILNGFLILSILLCGVFIFLSFRTLKLPNWYAIPVALGIAMLSPQLFRLSAHYGLAHPFVIPLVFWLSLVFHKNKSWGMSLGIALVLFLIAQLHFYLFAIGAALILALMVFKTMFAFNTKAMVFNFLHFLIQVILPFILLQIMLSDDLVDRPTKPFGFFAYKAIWESVFIPIDFQLGRWINQYIHKIPHFDREGIAYVGLIPVLFILKEFFMKIWNRFKGIEYKSILPDENRFFLKSSFWAAVLILIFSFGIPFIFPGLKELPEKLGPLAQFRSIGRFAWVFFYVFNIIAFYALYFQIQKLKKRGWQAIVYTLLLGVLLFEGGVFLFEKIELDMRKNPDIREAYQKSDNTWLDAINIEDYQAIINVPYFHIGSENIWISPSNKEVHRSLWLSVQTGLPITSSFMGRTSVGQVINQMELIAEPYRRPKILDDLPNQKDFLVFLHKKAFDRVSYLYGHFLRDLKLVHEDQEVKVFRMSIEEIEDRVGAKQKKVKKKYQDANLFKYKDLQSTDSLNNFFYQSFDDLPATKKYHGAGAFETHGYPETIIYDGHIPFQTNQESYVFSIWAYMQGDLNPKVKLSIEEYQAGTNYVFYKDTYELYKTFRSIDNGWILSEFPFKLGRPDSRIRVKVWNKDRGTESIFLDEMQIRKKGTQVYLKKDNNLMFNNRWFLSE